MRDATLVWLLGPPGGPCAEPRVLVGTEQFAKLTQAAPHVAADIRRAWADGSRVREYLSAEGRYSCTVHMAEGAAANPLDLVVTTSFKPLTQAVPSKLHSLLEYSPAAIALLHLRGEKLIYGCTNRAYKHLVSDSELEGRAFGSIFNVKGPSGSHLQQGLLHVAQTGKRLEMRQAEVSLDWLRTGKLQAKYFDVICEPVLGATGATDGLFLFAYDVTAQVEARREAERKEAHFRNLANSLPQIVWTADAAGVIDWLNARWYAFCGKTEDDPTAVDAAPLLHPDDLGSVNAAWQKSLESKTAFTQEMRMRDAEGKYRWFLVQTLPIVDPETSVLRWFGSSTEVHEQKKSTQAMADLLENMNDGYLAVDGQCIICDVNKRHVELTKVSKEDQLGRRVQDVFFTGIAENDSLFLRNCLKVLETRTAKSFDLYYEPLDLWTSISLYPTGDDGLTLIYRSLSAERSLQKNIESERQKFEAVFLDAPAGMALLRGAELIFEKANSRYQAILGNRPILGKTLEEAVPELESQPFRNLMREVYATGKPFVAKAMAADLLDPSTQVGRRSYFNFTYARICDGENRPYGIFLHVTDVTEEVLASRRADELAVSLSNAIEARDEFLSNASHELKTPVTSIKMQLQMTRRHVKPAEGKMPEATKLARTLDICSKQIDRLAALIEDLLDVSRISAGKMTFNYSSVILSDMVRDVTAQFAEHFLAAGCDLQVNIEPGVSLSCDSFRIEQVLVNLITNAIKYGAGSRVDVEVRSKVAGGAAIEVSDRGMGISDEKQHKIFERFERAVSHDNVAGLGLGLYICKQIVVAHNGSIAVYSRLGEGSKFTVDLPLDPRS